MAALVVVAAFNEDFVPEIALVARLLHAAVDFLNCVAIVLSAFAPELFGEHVRREEFDPHAAQDVRDGHALQVFVNGVDPGMDLSVMETVEGLAERQRSDGVENGQIVVVHHLNRFARVGHLPQHLHQEVHILDERGLLGAEALVAKRVAEQAPEPCVVFGIRDQNAHDAIRCERQTDWILQEFGAARHMDMDVPPRLGVGVTDLVWLDSDGVAVELMKPHQIMVEGSSEQSKLPRKGAGSP